MDCKTKSMGLRDILGVQKLSAGLENSEKLPTSGAISQQAAFP